MDAILEFINASLIWTPWFIGLLLFISGLGLPISEDVLVITAGVLAAKNPDYLIYLYAGVVTGAYFGDALTYWLGRIFGTKLLQTSLWRGKVAPEKLDKFSLHFSKNASLVILLGRFIPFGIRIFIYLTAGFTKYNYKKFAFIDLVAVFLTTGLTFFLSYTFGEQIVTFIDKAKYILLALIVIYVLLWLIKKVFKKTTGDSGSSH